MRQQPESPESWQQRGEWSLRKWKPAGKACNYTIWLPDSACLRESREHRRWPLKGKSSTRENSRTAWRPPFTLQRSTEERHWVVPKPLRQRNSHEGKGKESPASFQSQAEWQMSVISALRKQRWVQSQPGLLSSKICQTKNVRVTANQIGKPCKSQNIRKNT